MAVKVVAVPLQMVEVPDIEIVGKAFTKTAKLSELVQPLPSVPVTLYELFVIGLTEIELEVLPVLHKYELAPEIDKVVDCPIQTLVFPDFIRTGSELTVNCAEFDEAGFVGSVLSVTLQL